jgi:hypothetical protein
MPAPYSKACVDCPFGKYSATSDKVCLSAEDVQKSDAPRRCGTICFAPEPKAQSVFADTLMGCYKFAHMDKHGNPNYSNEDSTDFGLWYAFHKKAWIIGDLKESRVLMTTPQVPPASVQDLHGSLGSFASVKLAAGAHPGEEEGPGGGHAGHCSEFQTAVEAEAIEAAADAKQREQSLEEVATATGAAAVVVDNMRDKGATAVAREAVESVEQVLDKHVMKDAEVSCSFWLM